MGNSKESVLSDTIGLIMRHLRFNPKFLFRVQIG